MPYVPNFEVDVFVSYATANNQPINEGSPGWVTSVRDALKRMLDEGLGRRQASQMWMDDKLRGNEPFDEALRDKVSKSAVMLVFLSEAYLDSDWCRRELEIFARANGGERGRIFVAHYEPVPPDLWPAQLQGLSSEKYRFYRQDRDGAAAEPLGSPVPIPDFPGHQPFYQRLRELRQDLTAKLKDMKRRAEELPPSNPEPAATSTGPTAGNRLGQRQPTSSDRDVQNFIAEELLRAVCRQLNSGKEPFRSLRARLSQRLQDETIADGDVTVEVLREVLSHKLNQVMGALRQYVDKLETGEHVAELHKLTDSLGAAVVNANSFAELQQQLEKEGRIRIPELADIYLCEAVFTALYREPATWTRKQAIDQNKIHGIESASTLPQQRSLEIRRRLIEEYFPDRVQRQPGESQTDYDRRLDKFATHRLPSAFRAAREDQKPWLISFVGTVDFLEREFDQDPELWRHVIKVENSEDGDHIVIADIGDFQERLRLIHQKFDELQGKRRE